MLIVMKPSATAREVDAVVNVIQAVGFRAHPMPGATRTAIGITGNEGPVDGRRFEDLPILADALEEAGCANQDLLAHCRHSGEHVRGCWAVDLLLGKE